MLHPTDMSFLERRKTEVVRKSFNVFSSNISNGESTDLWRSLVGFVQIFLDRKVTSLESSAFTTYPRLVMLPNVRREYEERLIQIRQS